MKLYVVTGPASIRGLYETWDLCRKAVAGVSGARFQAVRSRAEAEALLSGDGIALQPGLYAFVDGNHLGGVGVVLVTQMPEESPQAQEISTSVEAVFTEAHIPSLVSSEAIASALARLRNVLAELAGLYEALRRLPDKASVTVVHDYAGVGAWLTGAWNTKDSTVKEVVEVCRGVIAAKELTAVFRYQPGHESTFAGRNDFAFYNGRADQLAAQVRRDT